MLQMEVGKTYKTKQQPAHAAPTVGVITNPAATPFNVIEEVIVLLLI